MQYHTHMVTNNDNKKSVQEVNTIIKSYQYSIERQDAAMCNEGRRRVQLSVTVEIHN